MNFQEPSQFEETTMIATENVDELDFGEMIRVVLFYSRTIVLVMGLSLVLGLIYAFCFPPTFKATTFLKVPESSPMGDRTMGLLDFLSAGGNQMDTYTEICQLKTVANRAIQALTLQDKAEYQGLSQEALLEKLRKNVEVASIKKSTLVSITVKSQDPQLAADLANAWSQAFIDVNLDLIRSAATSKRKFIQEQVDNIQTELKNPNLRLDEESKADEVMYDSLMGKLKEARVAENVEDPGIVIVDPATKPLKPVSPKKTEAVLASLLIGLAVGIQLAFFLNWRRDFIMDEDRLGRITGLPNYAVVPELDEKMINGKRAQGRNVHSLIHRPEFRYPDALESYRFLRTNLLLAPANKPLNAIAVLSADHDEGKTLMASNLAISLAQSGKRTLLVDADFRHPSVAGQFGLSVQKEVGLPLALSGQKSWASMVRASSVEGLDLLPNSVIPVNAPELLGSARMDRLVSEFREKYDMVVFDGAPVLPFSDSAVLSSHLDGVIVLVRFEFTKAVDLSRALDQLRHVGANLIGTVFNRVRARKVFWGHEYGYGYSQLRSKWMPSASQTGITQGTSKTGKGP